MKAPRITSVRSVLREHPDLKKGGWKELPVPPHIREQTHVCSKIKRFLLNREVSVQVYETNTEWCVVQHLLVRPHLRVRQFPEVRRG